jgi:hypothetical protein
MSIKYKKWCFLWYTGFITSDPLSKFYFIQYRPLHTLRAQTFIYLGTIRRFSWNDTTGSMITAVWTHLRMFLNSKFSIFVFKCWILLKPVLGGVDGNLNFPLPSMNRLNQTEPATFSILSCLAFFRDSVFLYFTVININIFTNSK